MVTEGNKLLSIIAPKDLLHFLSVKIELEMDDQHVHLPEVK